MEAPFFSIIVPIYNVASYLEKCIYSILEQRFTDFEVILVDDGATDCCPQICDNFKTNYPSIFRVVHKSNGGSSSARNAGLDIAKGDYIIFVDSDDYWDNPNALMFLHNRIKQFGEDLILYDCEIIHEDGKRERTRGNYDLSILDRHDKHKSLEYLVSNNLFPGAAWIMATRRFLIDRLHLKFPIGVTAEDYIWVLSLIKECKKIGAVNGSWYKYVKRGESITSQTRLSGIMGMTMAIDDALQKRLSLEYPELRPYLNRLCLLSIMAYNNLPSVDKPDALKRIKHVIPALSFAPKVFVSLFGVSATSFFIRLGYSLIR